MVDDILIFVQMCGNQHLVPDDAEFCESCGLFVSPAKAPVEALKTPTFALPLILSLLWGFGIFSVIGGLIVRQRIAKYQVSNPTYRPASIANVATVISWLGIAAATLWSVLPLMRGSY
jgi:hypothetical protein